MVYAQISCGSVQLENHHDSGDAYKSRSNLSVVHAGDVFAAMCCFGICATDGTADSIQRAVGEIDRVGMVERKIIRNCRVVFDKSRDAVLYDPNEQAGITAEVNEDGIVTPRFTGAGAHFVSTEPAGGNAEERMAQAVAQVRRSYCQPLDQDPGGPVQGPLALDYQDSIFIVDQGNVSLPVLVYNGSVCVDYTSGSLVEGVEVINNAQGVSSKCSTRDLYSSLELESIHRANAGANRVQVAYTRRIPALGEGLGTLAGMACYSARLRDWLTSTFADQHRIMGYELQGQLQAGAGGGMLAGAPAGGAGAARILAVELQNTPINDGDTAMADSVLNQELAREDQADQPFVDHHDRSLLGGPLPLMIVPDGKPLAGAVLVAPLDVNAGASFTARISHDGPIDTEMLADRLSRTGSRNVIGVAMQKIAPNTQGDIMLHDGV